MSIQVTYDQDSLDRFMDWLEQQRRDATYLLTTELKNNDQERIHSIMESMRDLNQATILVKLFLDEDSGYGAEPHAEHPEV